METKTHDEECPFCRGLHWHKYNYLEQKMIQISKFITIDERNYNAWGEEIADLIVLIGNAMDVFFKDMYDCPNFSGSFSKEKQKITIKYYKKIYEPYYELSKNSVKFSFGLGTDHSLFPFTDFETKTPSWWDAYNHTKHEFYSNMEEANLGNTLNALGALLILNSLHLCSRWFLIFTREIKSRPDYMIDNPDLVLRELTRSKIGTTIWGNYYSVQTTLFEFRYRVDETITIKDEPLLTTFFKNGDPRRLGIKS